MGCVRVWMYLGVARWEGEGEVWWREGVVTLGRVRGEGGGEGRQQWEGWQDERQDYDRIRDSLLIFSVVFLPVSRLDNSSRLLTHPYVHTAVCLPCYPLLFSYPTFLLLYTCQMLTLSCPCHPVSYLPKGHTFTLLQLSSTSHHYGGE